MLTDCIRQAFLVCFSVFFGKMPDFRVCGGTGFFAIPAQREKRYKECMMAKKRLVLGIALFVMVMVSACAQKYDDEKDFRARPLNGGKGIEITGYVGDKFEVRIPQRIQNLPVTHIGEQTFDRKKNIISITIPDGITTIRELAFTYCSNLSSITIPNSVISIEDAAFDICTSLASIIIPNSITSIGNCAFEGCTSLTNVKFEGTIRSDNFHPDVFGQDYSIYYIGDLRDKYLAGGKGTYTRSSGSKIWTKK
jgi:hypothetical protein